MDQAGETPRQAGETGVNKDKGGKRISVHVNRRPGIEVVRYTKSVGRARTLGGIQSKTWQAPRFVQRRDRDATAGKVQIGV